MARTRRRAGQTPPQRLILDSGAVIALARNDARARAALTAAYEARAMISIPAVVVAETVRGTAGDAPTNRVIKAVGHVVAVDEPTSRLAGALLGAARSSATIDAIVVATALRLGPAVVLTGDPEDLTALAADHPELTIQAL